MVQRYSFILVFALLLAGLAVWDLQVQSSILRKHESMQRPDVTVNPIFARQVLVESLDRIVTYEYYYHSVYGRFSNSLAQIGFEVPKGLAGHYELRIVEATDDRLWVTAHSLPLGKSLEIASVDQDFQLHTNFELPVPSVEYLKARANQHLHLLKGMPEGQSVAEQGIYKDYFRFSVEVESRGGRIEKVARAVGIRAPVYGLFLGGEASERDAPRLLQTHAPTQSLPNRKVSGSFVRSLEIEPIQ